MVRVKNKKSSARKVPIREITNPDNFIRERPYPILREICLQNKSIG